VVDIAVGTLSLGVAWSVARGHTDRFTAWHALRRAAAAEPSWATRVLQRGSVLLAFVAGVVLNLPSLWYLVALTDIAEADISFAHELLLILAFNVVMFLLVEVSLALCVFAPTRAERLNQSIMGWIRGHAREIVIWLAATVGVWLVVKGIVAAV
jgi:Sap, sulfolipid-1-addressing protein